MPDHQMTHDPDNDRYICTTCGVTYHSPELKTRCIGVTLYQWGEWPEHLLTKKQLSDAGFQTGKKLPSPAGAVWRDKSPNGIMYLYDRGQGIPKKEVTPEQKSKLDEARKKAVAGWYCSRCGDSFGHYRSPGALCNTCIDHDEMVEWAQRQLASNSVIMDTETTGLRPGYSEIIEICFMTISGEVLLNTRIKPQHPERMFESGESGLCAYNIHGIHPDMLVDAPSFPDVYPKIREIMEAYPVLIYNRDFDMPMLRGDIQRHELPAFNPKDIDCVMLAYSQWVGECSSYHRGYRYQSLGGGHSALEDCLAVIDRMRTMAADEKQTENQTNGF
jgi:DNA polymerase-3 subunit epsilon